MGVMLVGGSIPCHAVPPLSAQQPRHLLTAAGGGACCACMQVLADFYRTFLSLRNLSIVSIAAINGAAVGGGMGLAAAADIRIAASTARLGYNFVKLGLSPGVLSAQPGH